MWWFTQAKVLLLYLKLTTWPWPLSIHYEMPYLATLGAAWPWLLTVGLLAMTTLVLLWRRSSIGFVFAWVLIILSPTLVVPIVTEVAAERRMYLPLAALVTLLIVGGYALAQQVCRWLASVSRRPTTDRAAIAVCSIAAVAMVLIWSALDLRRLAAYHDALTLWQDTVSNQPTDPLAHNNLAQALTDAGRPEEAIEQCNAALRLKPDFADAYCNLGVALAACGRVEAAIHQYQESIRLKSANPLAYNNLGNALLRIKQPERALEQYELALQIKPSYGDAHANLAAALANMGRWQNAIEQYQLALQIKPDNFDALANLALAYAAIDRRSDAMTAAENALRLAKSHGDIALADQIDSWLSNYRARQTDSRSVQP
jgi:tetratricopeptide (TPR) repeat protein